MQWFKSAMVVSSAVFVAAMAANGCSSSNPGGNDAGDSGIKKTDGGKDAQQGTDSGVCPSGAPSCESCDVSSFAPSGQNKPVGPYSKACSAQDITDLVNACLGSSAAQDGSTCQAWQKKEGGDAGNAACLSCAFSFQTDANWGLLVCDPNTGSCSINIPGCLDLALNQVSQENSTSNGSCGDYLAADFGCQDAACSTCTAGTSDQNTCLQDAIGTECKSYVDAFDSAAPCQALNGDAAPPLANNCTPANQTSFTDTEWTTLANFFCGTAP